MTSTAPVRPAADPDRGYSPLNPAYPRSWWTIAWSSDVAAGQVVPARLLERDVVLWRDSSETLHCMAAHCPHLGAHLGTGGTVVNDELRCPFHGWRYDISGDLVAVNGPGRVRKGICLPRYQITERHGGVFLWNGADEPDIAFPDILSSRGLHEDDVVFCHNRWLLPFPAKHFAENNPDGPHFAVAHDTGGWGESVILEEAPTVLRVENRVHDAPKWWTWENLSRKARKREISNVLAPVPTSLTHHCYGATLFEIHPTSGNGIFGSLLLCITPVEEDSCLVMDMMLMPRVRVPLIGPLIQRGINLVLGPLSWGTVRQDLSLMLRRREPANPPYAASDKATIAFRRLWDSRIDTDQPLDGESVRHNGRRAGIKPPHATTKTSPSSLAAADMPPGIIASASVEVGQ
ncbi:Rieske 2Fe-2S domain-containing protein [Mycobacterium avium]|uniref:Rieske 2Fe-2S domain-containing protein n=1 Tax=Mycobacterium avium TaxID=1764 RepID=UPI0009BCEEB3|nr:Rieske 2Fe-2S domain-containing protein [Mycobacterium avium]